MSRFSMPRATLLLFALTAVFPAAGPRAAPAPPGPAAEIDAFDYLYVDPYRPRFVETPSPTGTTEYRTRPCGGRKPENFPARKAPGTRRVFVVGGSVAQLYDGLGRSSLGEALALAAPGGSVETINAGSTAYDSARDALAVREVLAYEPDLIVVMSGVNERIFLPPAWVARLDERLRALPVLERALRGLVLRARRGEETPDGAGLARAFDGNIRGMVRAARARGVPVVLCTLPVDLRDMPPRGTLPLGDPEFFSAWRDWERGRLRRAARGFERWAASRPNGFFGAYFQARCLDRLGDHAGARAAYLRAWNRPAGASMPALNESLRRIAREEGAGLADVERAFESASAHGLIGRNLMEDDVHWDHAADPLVSAEIALAARGLAASGARAAPPRALDAYAARALDVARSLKPGRKASWMVFRFRAWDPAILGRQLFSERELSLLETIREANPELLADSAAFKSWMRDALAGNIWDSKAAARLDEWWPVFLAHVGETYRRRGEAAPAAAYFEEALRLKPDMDVARVHAALAHLAAGRREQARRDLAPLRGSVGDPGARARLKDGELAALLVGVPARAGADGGGAPDRLPSPPPARLAALAAEGARVLKGPTPDAAGANASMLRCVKDVQVSLWRDALRECQRTVALGPERLDVLLDALCAQGYAFDALGDRASAAASWRRALSLAPADWPRREEILWRFDHSGSL